MIGKSEIQRNLRSLNALYGHAATQKHALYYSKLAIIELCGWIEMSMDDIVRRCAIRTLQDPESRKRIDKAIKRTYGFDYDQHFRELLLLLIGAIRLEKVERKVDAAKYTRLISALTTLKTIRNDEAHTYIKGTTRKIDAPSVTLARFLDVYDGLVDIDSVIRSQRF